MSSSAHLHGPKDSHQRWSRFRGSGQAHGRSRREFLRVRITRRTPVTTLISVLLDDLSYGYQPRRRSGLRPIVKSSGAHLLREALIARNRLQRKGNLRRAPALRIWGLNLFSSLLLLHSLLHLPRPRSSTSSIPVSSLLLLHLPPSSILYLLHPPFSIPRSSTSSILPSLFLDLLPPPSSLLYSSIFYLLHPPFSIPRPQIRTSSIRSGRGGTVRRHALALATHPVVGAGRVRAGYPATQSGNFRAAGGEPPEAPPRKVSRLLRAWCGMRSSSPHSLNTYAIHAGLSGEQEHGDGSGERSLRTV